jgi:flagella basal body P-ring formation protein FlgA
MKKLISIFISSAAAVAISANVAFATPVLKPHVKISSKIVTVGDMFDNAGALAEKGLFRSPEPGTLGNVPLASISMAAERAGITSFDDRGLSSVRVERTGIAINRDFLNQLFERELAARNLLQNDQQVQFNNFGGFTTIYAEEAMGAPVEVLDFYFDQQTQRVQAKLAVLGQDSPLTLDGRIDVLAPVAHLRRTMNQGEIVDINDLEFRPTPVRFGHSQGELQVADILGKSLTRTVRENTMLRPTDLTDPLIIARNDMVTLLFRKGPLKLTVKGQALNAASVDQPVTVLNLMSKKVVQGIASANGTVIITNDPTRLASR